MGKCLFCSIDQSDYIYQDQFCYVVYDKYPISKGHLLIISKEHYNDWFSAPKDLQCHVIGVANEMKSKLEEEFSPDGYNIGINVGEHAGQSIEHLHIHLIPRYVNDGKITRKECQSM